MNKISLMSLSLLAPTLLSACTGLPSFVVNPEQNPIKTISGKDISGTSTSDPTSLGPKVASLIANMKCEIHKAVNSDKILPYYVDDLPLRTKNHDLLDEKSYPIEKKNSFTLRNIFSEIEYVAQATFTLDVTESGFISPLSVFTEPLSAASGLLPATSRVLTVGATIGEKPHRMISFNQTVEFGRLLPARLPTKDDRKLSRYLDCVGTGSGSELAGDLGLEEVLATGLVAASMSDITVFPSDPQKTKLGSAPIPKPLDASNIFGSISTQIDFTIDQGVNGGPTWNLRRVKVGGSGNGFFGASRQIVDKLTLTFVPVCSRILPKNDMDKQGRYDYDNLADGTPGWANYLPLCFGKGASGDMLARAVETGHQNNNLLRLISGREQQ